MGHYLFYQVFVNGSPNVDARQNRFAVVHGLTPETTYQITVKARDLYGPPNVSAPSNVLTVTTAAVSASGHRAALIARQPARLGRRRRGPRNQFVLDGVLRQPDSASIHRV